MVGCPVVLRTNAKFLETHVIIGIQIEGQIMQHVCHCNYYTGTENSGLHKKRQRQKLVAPETSILARKCKET